jgi:hypothetical protein
MKPNCTKEETRLQRIEKALKSNLYKRKAFQSKLTANTKEKKKK